MSQTTDAAVSPNKCINYNSELTSDKAMHIAIPALTYDTIPKKVVTPPELLSLVSNALA